MDRLHVAPAVGVADEDQKAIFPHHFDWAQHVVLNVPVQVL
ncbi:MAG TPA: hypothetical protein VMV23_03380 [Candidatus Nanopelagicaceae bacterium]|nr:hypothetical protein [Candidatus Nanopelagicaceae bacterium]